MTIHKIEGSAPYSAHALHVEEMRAAQEQWRRDFLQALGKLEQLSGGLAKSGAIRAELESEFLAPMRKIRDDYANLAKAAAAKSRLAKLRKASEQEAREACKRNREMLRIRDLLRKSEAVKNALKAKGNLPALWDLRDAESAAVLRLAALEAEQKAASNRSRFRSEMEARAAKARRAKIERGVTFDRMV